MTEPTIDRQVAALLASLPSSAVLPDADLRDRLVQLERVVNIVQAAQADVMVELSRRAVRADVQDERVGVSVQSRRGEFVADEIAVTLSCTKAEAARRYGLALHAAEHPQVALRWRRGDIGGRKTQVICDALTDVASPAAEVLAPGR